MGSGLFHRSSVSIYLCKSFRHSIRCADGNFGLVVCYWSQSDFDIYFGNCTGIKEACYQSMDLASACFFTGRPSTRVAVLGFNVFGYESLLEAHNRYRLVFNCESTLFITPAEQFADPDGHKLSIFISTSVSGPPTGSLLTLRDDRVEPSVYWRLD